MDPDDNSGPNPVLFTRKMARPCIFTMASHHKRVELKQLILERGGVLEDTKFRDDDGGRIEIADRNAVNVKRTIDVFDYKYITACIESNQLRKDLKKYRINEESAFTDYDPYLVLIGRLKWKDVKKVDEGESCSDMDDDGVDDLAGVRREMASWPKSTLKSASRGLPYNKKEQMAIINFIIEDKAFTLVKGKKLWERMETRKVCNRTAQSMAEHFKKQIIPQIRGFGLDAKIVSKFLRGLDGEEVNSTDDEESDDIPAGNKNAYTPNDLADISEEEECDELADNHQRSPERKGGRKKLFCKQLGLQEFTPRQTPAGRNSLPKTRSSQPQEIRETIEPGSRNENLPPPDRSRDEDSEPIPSTSRGVRRGRGMLPLTSDENSDDSMPIKGIATSSPKKSEGSRSTRVRKIINEDDDESPALFVSPKRPKMSEKRPTRSANLDITASSIPSSGNYYTAEEDKEILTFIVKNNRIGDVKGNVLWELMEQKGVAIGRTHQSMKERFRKTISQNIDNYEDIVVDKDVRKRIKNLYLAKKSTNATLDDTGSSMSCSKFYTTEEDNDILKFIVENNRLDDVKGRALWELMEERGIANGRSHQSMKERFRKTISKNIENYDDVVVDKAIRIKIRYLWG